MTYSAVLDEIATADLMGELSHRRKLHATATCDYCGRKPVESPCRFGRRHIGVDNAGPEIVVLCGSTRFGDAFAEANRRLTLEGRIVLSVGEYTRSLRGVSPQEAFGEEAKARLDELHKRKIDLADRVLVLNVGGYIGDSTRSEIAYAAAHGKPIEYLEDERADGDAPITASVPAPAPAGPPAGSPAPEPDHGSGGGLVGLVHEPVSGHVVAVNESLLA